MKFRFIEDPGHGWLEVDRADLNRFGLGASTSGCSYQNRDKVYLEEDCDAGPFVDAVKAAGNTVEIVTVYQENTPIRNYAGYTPRGAQTIQERDEEKQQRVMQFVATIERA